MSESILKKEFKESDLQRMRNLVNKKFGDSTKTQVGYQKEVIDRKEGEIWEENGKKWTIKNGIKTSIGKFDDIKKLFQLPLLCPECHKPMKTHLDKKFYPFHQKCFNCVIDMESRLRIEGKWEEYEKKYTNQYTNEVLSELEKEMEEFFATSETFLTEQGDIEDWGNGENKEKIKAEIKEYIKNIKSKLK